MRNLRKYGNAPFKIAVIHGGPGAPGEMASIAREISSVGGVLEPLQTAPSIEGQIRELKDVLKMNGNLPVTLIGWSWGAWLSFIFAAKFPEFARKLILIGSGPFKEECALKIMRTRLSRLSKAEKAEALLLIKTLDDPAIGDKDTLMARLGKLMTKADSYDPLPHTIEILKCQFDIHQRVWKQAEKLRSKGRLLEFGKKIQCPVLAIHGDYDPHPSEGIKQPLSRILKDFRFILLENCGHKPWIERSAKVRFFNILKSECE